MLKQLYYVYVIELTDEAGPRVNTQKPCVYVGQTSTSPEERFAQHKRGYKASRKVRKYGVRLRARLYANFNPLQTREDAEATERRLADRLRRRGFTVFSG